MSVAYPKVDMAYAATLRPSKLTGKSLMLMVNVVAGVGVSVKAARQRDPADLSLFCLVMTKVSFRECWTWSLSSVSEPSYLVEAVGAG